MILSFIPQYGDHSLMLERTGPASITINGDELDLSGVPVGAVVEEATTLHPMLAANIEITEDGPHVTFILPHRICGYFVPEIADIVDPPIGVIDLPVLEQEGA